MRLSNPPRDGWQRCRIARRSVSDPSDVRAFVSSARAGTSLAALVHVVGQRWTVEQSIYQPNRLRFR